MLGKSFHLSHSFHVYGWWKESALCFLPALVYLFLCGRNSLGKNQIWLLLSCPQSSLFWRQRRTKSKLNLKFKVLHDCNSNQVLQSWISYHFIDSRGWSSPTKLHSSPACAIHGLFPPGKIQLACQGSAQSSFVRYPYPWSVSRINLYLLNLHSTFLIVLLHHLVIWWFSC